MLLFQLNFKYDFKSLIANLYIKTYFQKDYCVGYLVEHEKFYHDKFFTFSDFEKITTMYP